MIIGKTFTFESAHHLPGHEKCGRVHGHTYKLTVELEGIVLPSGMVMDLHVLSKLVMEVIKNFDHANLDDYFDTPTCENLVEAIWNGMIQVLIDNWYDPEMLYSVQLQEGEGGYAKRTR